MKKTWGTDFPTTYPDMMFALDFGRKIKKLENYAVEEALGEFFKAWDHVAEDQSVHLSEDYILGEICL